MSDDDWMARKWFKEQSLIILDSEFNKIGEVLLGKGLEATIAFINEDGVFILLLDEEEDVMKFTQMILTYKTPVD